MYYEELNQSGTNNVANVINAEDSIIKFLLLYYSYYHGENDQRYYLMTLTHMFFVLQISRRKTNRESVVSIHTAFG